MTDARRIVAELGGRWRARGAACRCPAHDDRTPSLHVSLTRDGRPLVYCFAGCTQTQVIGALRARGLWDGAATVDPAYPGYLTRPHDGHTDRSARERQAYARALWDMALPIMGTLVETYLEARAIPAAESPALRFLPRHRHRLSGKDFPCMIAKLSDEDGKLVAVQRTWLARDGRAKAPVEAAKMTLGPMGSAAVRLHEPASALGLAEGIETALSARHFYRVPVWACLSAARLKTVAIPRHVEALYIFADPGTAGREEAFKAADAFERDGRIVDVLFPETHFKSGADDFNALAQAGGR